MVGEGPARGVTPIGAPGARAPAGFLVGHLDGPINNAWAEPLTDRAGGPVGRWAPNVSVRISIGGGEGPVGVRWAPSGLAPVGKIPWLRSCPIPSFIIE